MSRQLGPGVRLGASLALVWAGSVLVLAVAGGGRYWAYIAAEDTPMTWLQSVVLVLTAAAWGFAAYLHRVATGRYRGLWLVLAAGFLMLALDERFALHERIRDRILAPADIRVPFLPWVGPGDFLILATALAGLTLAPRLWRALEANGSARTLFVAGVALAIVAVGMDSVDPAGFELDFERLEQTLEECVELAAAMALLGAALSWVAGAVQPARVLASPPQRAPGEDPDPAAHRSA